jgi:ActR/RegA family two-component response regulator
MDNARPEKAGGNLLVVDDDLHFRQTLEALLTGEGYDVRCAPSGGMALMFAGEDPRTGRIAGISGLAGLIGFKRKVSR